MSKGNILLIETATEICSVAICNNEKILSSKQEQVVTKHVSRLPLMIQECLEATHLAFKDLGAVAISDGPGSYTALRVGASTAKGICFALSIPLIKINTLQSLANGVLLSETNSGPIVPMIDARRMEVFTATYDTNLEPIKPTHNFIWSEEIDLSYFAPNSILCGSGAEKIFQKIFEQRRDIKLSKIKECNAEYLFSIALKKYQKMEFEQLYSYSPAYFKLPNITTPKKNVI